MYKNEIWNLKCGAEPESPKLGQPEPDHREGGSLNTGLYSVLYSVQISTNVLKVSWLIDVNIRKGSIN